MRRKIDLNRLRHLDVLPEDRELLEKYVRWDFLTEEELKRVVFLDFRDINDWDFNPLDEEEEMYFIANNNEEGFEILQKLTWEEFQKEKVKQLEITREKARIQEEKDIEEFYEEKKKNWIILWEIKQTKTEEEKKQVTFRLSVSDIEKIKKMAEQEGLPYQTLIWAIIHKIANKRIELVLK